MEAISQQMHSQRVLAERYRLIAELGRGGMGRVFQAEHLMTQRPVALKLMHRRIARDPKAVARFMREARCASAVRHAHIVDVLDMGMHEGAPFLVMELLEGPTLAQWIARTGALSVADALTLLAPIADALVALHARGIVHRDVKPGNILLREHETGPSAVLLDFGLALDGEGARLTGDAIAGTPHYMAPERMSPGEAGPLEDLWSFAAVLFFALSASTPRAGEQASQILAAFQRGLVRPLRSVRADVPADVAAVIDRALRRDPGQRQVSVAAFCADLAEAADNEALRMTARATFPPARATEVMILSQRSRAPWLLLALAALATGAALRGGGRALERPRAPLSASLAPQLGTGVRHRHEDRDRDPDPDRNPHPDSHRPAGAHRDLDLDPHRDRDRDRDPDSRSPLAPDPGFLQPEPEWK